MNQGRGISSNLHNSISIFKILRFDNQQFNVCFSCLVLPTFQLFLITMPTFCNYLLISLNVKLGWSVFMTVIIIDLTCLGVVYTAFEFAASVYSNSVAYLNLFKKIVVMNNLAPEDRKTFKSLLPLKVHFGDFYYIQKFTVLRALD